MISPFKYELPGYGFAPDGNIFPVSTPLTPLAKQLMQTSLDQAELSLETGGTPIGAALVDLQTGQLWFNHADDTTTGDAESHAEMKCYRDARRAIGKQLGSCALISTTEPCLTCVESFAESKIQSIVIAAPWSILTREDETPILPRSPVNMGQLLEVSNIRTYVYSGYRADESVALWRRWDRLRSN